MGRVVLGKTLKCVQACQANGRAVAAQLPGHRSAQLGDAAFGRIEPGDLVRGLLTDVGVLAEPLTAQSEQQRCSTTSAGPDRQSRF
ncbi:hypothetical protein [Streptomyces bluensis]|uniref:hypothetical protein n=1 Tax=Streptomyces bluensis TaxID=33897 RepID=UPI001064E609|nr:hypothetical protein [Streptomyces bluensis]GGZ97438.1 hypothetical protein GCM10010344_76880 [Streptomyces bluensis]